MEPQGYIQECREWIARRRAFIDQHEKMMEDQYPMMRPGTNRMRLEDLEAWKFELEIHEWELSQYISSLDE